MPSEWVRPLHVAYTANTLRIVDSWLPPICMVKTRIAFSIVTFKIDIPK